MYFLSLLLMAHAGLMDCRITARRYTVAQPPFTLTLGARLSVMYQCDVL